MLLDLLGADLADHRHARRGLTDDEPGAGEHQGSQATGVEGVGEQGGVLDPEVAGGDPVLDRVREAAQAGGHPTAQLEQRPLGDLVEELAARPPHQGLGAVEERRVRERVVGEGGDDRGHPRLGGRGFARRGVEQLGQLREVADHGQREQVLLAGEVPVDDGPVDPDGAGDVVDVGLADTALVEELPRRRHDLGLARPATGRGRRTSAVGGGWAGHEAHRRRGCSANRSPIIRWVSASGWSWSGSGSRAASASP